MWPQPSQLEQPVLESLLAAAFSMRRKLLRHGLGPWLATRGYQGNFDLQRRAEEVPVAEYIALAQSV
jgi:16S rRNA (adenine1518-N6/adenine1519-N6)-dimethyltransferase